MNKLKEMFLGLLRGMWAAIARFPLTIVCLGGAAALVCYMISIHNSPPVMIQKLTFTCLVGAVLGMAAQFAAERFEKLAARRLAVYGMSVLLTAGYFFILWPVTEIRSETGIRTFVAVFALICAVLWLPAYQKKADFNEICLIHFKSVFTSVLYSAVLSAGIAAILAAVDILLFHIPNDAYSYMMAIVWILFAAIYYLSLLPRFHSQEETDLAVIRNARHYPRFLEILVSYIAIPLVTVYTVVLLAYFIKILVTLRWPSGQLGPMVLIYSAAGLVIFVLASLLANRFAALYIKIFPKVLIPVVLLQLVSVGIRLNAYAVTESRYYVALFGIFSVITGILLSMKPIKRNSMIALLAAVFAVISIIPPVDAFTVSRITQIQRLEKMLTAENILVDGTISAKPDASENIKIETTNILNYLNNHNYLKYVSWLPQDFDIYQDMKSTFGFDQAYPGYDGEQNRYFAAGIDNQKPILISDYDIAFTVSSYRYPDKENQPVYDFSVNGANYTLKVSRVSAQEVRIAVQNQAGTELIATGLYEFALGLSETSGAPKEALPPERMTLAIDQNGYKLKVILQNVNITFGTGADAGADYTALVLFSAL